MSKFRAIVKIEMPVYCEFICPYWKRLSINELMAIAKDCAKNKIAPQDLRPVYLGNKNPKTLYEDGKSVVWLEE